MNFVKATINVIDGSLIDQSGLETGPKEVSNYTSIIDLLANLLLLHFPCFPSLQKYCIRTLHVVLKQVTCEYGIFLVRNIMFPV